MNVGNCIFLKLYLAMVEIWIPHKVWAAILSYDLTSSLGWDNSFHMSNSVASQRHLATSLWNLKRDEGGIGLQQEKHFSRLFSLNTGSSSASFVVRLRWDARGVGWKSIPLVLFPSRDTLSRTFHRGEVVGCRCEETRQLALHWGDRGAPHIGDWRVTRLLQNATSWDISFLPCIEETGVAGRRQLTLVKIAVKTHASHSDWNTLGRRVTLVLQNATASSSGEWEISFLPRRHLCEGKLSKITARRHLPDVHWHRFYFRLGRPWCGSKNIFPKKKKIWQIWQYITHKFKTNGIIVVALWSNIFCKINFIFCSGCCNGKAFTLDKRTLIDSIEFS